jgi:hypothetical protein
VATNLRSRRHSRISISAARATTRSAQNCSKGLHRRHHAVDGAGRRRRA